MNADKWLQHFNEQVVAAYDEQFAVVVLGEHRLECQVASTHESRVRGLSEHTEMPRDGMLFIYNEDHSALFHRKTMAFDISIWFFDAEGNLVGWGWDDQVSHAASAPYRYVLETHSDFVFNDFKLEIASLSD